MVEWERVYLGLGCQNPLDHVNGVMKEISPNSSIELTESTLAEIRTLIKFKNLPHGQRIKLTNCLLFKTEAPDKVIGEVLATLWRRYPTEVEQTISDKGQLQHSGILRACIIHIGSTFKYADHARLAELISTTSKISKVSPVRLLDNCGKNLRHENKAKMLRMIDNLQRNCNAVDICIGCQQVEQQGKTFIPLPSSSQDTSAHKLVEVSPSIDSKTCSCKENPRKRKWQTKSPKHKKQNAAADIKRDITIPRDLSQTIFHDYDIYSFRGSSTQLETEKSTSDIDFGIEWTYV
ncbi:hypothetical protein DIURU_002543 [Diutina rugosa]|uniref:Uncharacterized protein n=1 Tax=Diutina rugosa TaxID=5481 RepID=A0A642UPS0_DIURU|nr:uncharacterized protein DIURU_002543 [Diutina rugosa]KAA8903256.1 hypothetical protein DIURU_002543 [Diutina rugosa]